MSVIKNLGKAAAVTGGLALVPCLVFLAVALAGAPPRLELVELASLQPGERFEHDGSVWMRCQPHWTGYADSDEAMAAGMRAEKDVADGGTVRVWIVCLTDGPWHQKGHLRPVWETGTVRRVP